MDDWTFLIDIVHRSVSKAQPCAGKYCFLILSRKITRSPGPGNDFVFVQRVAEHHSGYPCPLPATAFTDCLAAVFPELLPSITIRKIRSDLLEKNPCENIFIQAAFAGFDLKTSV